MATLLHQAGYATGIIGKWGLGRMDTSGHPAGRASITTLATKITGTPTITTRATCSATTNGSNCRTSSGTSDCGNCRDHSLQFPGRGMPNSSGEISAKPMSWRIHLNDDQGWRIEIEKYPRLTEVGAWRDETLVGHSRRRPHEYDGQPHGGFYTQEEIRDLVRYAAERHVTIVPEISMPGHPQVAGSRPHRTGSSIPWGEATVRELEQDHGIQSMGGCGVMLCYVRAPRALSRWTPISFSAVRATPCLWRMPIVTKVRSP